MHLLWRAKACPFLLPTVALCGHHILDRFWTVPESWLSHVMPSLRCNSSPV
jgi:hypothetical protein